MAVIGYTRHGLPIYLIAGAAEEGAVEGGDVEGGEGEDQGDTESDTGAGAEVDYKAEADKHKALSRKWEGRAKANAEAAKRLKGLEDSKKSEVERATEKVTEAEKRAADAELKATRYEVAAEKGVPAGLVRFLSGGSREDIEEAADALLAHVKNDTGDTSGRNGATPKEKLRSGATGGSKDDSDPSDYKEHAAKLPRY